MYGYHNIRLGYNCQIPGYIMGPRESNYLISFFPFKFWLSNDYERMGDFTAARLAVVLAIRLTRNTVYLRVA